MISEVKDLQHTLDQYIKFNESFLKLDQKSREEADIIISKFETNDRKIKDLVTVSIESLVSDLNKANRKADLQLLLDLPKYSFKSDSGTWFTGKYLTSFRTQVDIGEVSFYITLTGFIFSVDADKEIYHVAFTK